MIDCVYIAASKLDSRFTRICVASVRYFYPDIPIRLLIGGRLQSGFVEELVHYWDVTIADVPAGDYGWGFVKLEPLFKPTVEKFLMLDSDTIITGNLLEQWNNCDAPFVVDNEAYTESEIPLRYYDWRKVREIDSTAIPPVFVFNSGQWIGTSGVLSRADFSRWIDWTFPRRLRFPEPFFPGDQGVLNYVLVQKAMLDKLPVRRQPLMLWPGHGLGELRAKAIEDRTAVPVIVHWAGMKKLRHGTMVGAELLAFFEEYYYQKLRWGKIRRLLALCRDFARHCINAVEVRMTLLVRKHCVRLLKKSSA